MNARIGVADSDKVIEIEIDDVEEFRRRVEEALSGEVAVVWFTDTRKRQVGVSVQRVAYVEIDAESGRRSVGFGPALPLAEH